MNGEIIDVCSFTNSKGIVIYFKAIERIETIYNRAFIDNNSYIVEIPKTVGYWFINQWGEKLSFHKDLKSLALYIADGWGKCENFKILI